MIKVAVARGKRCTKEGARLTRSIRQVDDERRDRAVCAGCEVGGIAAEESRAVVQA